MKKKKTLRQKRTYRLIEYSSSDEHPWMLVRATPIG